MPNPDITINVSFSNDAPSRQTAGNRKKQNKRKRKRGGFLKNVQHSKPKGYQKGKPNHQTGLCGDDQASPCQNGAPSERPSPPPSSTAASCTVTGNKGSTHSPSVSTSVQKTAGNPSKYVAIDCEMVGTGPKGSISQLARCSIVSYDGDVVYDKFVNPPVPVTDYRTRWSGIRPRDLVKASPYPEARKEILKLLMGKVVIGHAIHNDFKALGYSHPAVLTRDTSRIPLLNKKAGFAVHECASLKRLTKAIFNRDIQTGRKGHSSVEDAKATMELYKVVEEEWERQLVSRSQSS